MKNIQYTILILIIFLSIFLYQYNKNYIDFFSVNIVDDIIHNKYEKNTDEYYVYRNNRDELLLKQDRYNLIIYDNLAVWYDHLWNLDKALELYKTKKILLDSKEEDIENLYRYHANIGTFFIHDGIKKWFKNKNDSDAQKIIIDWKNHIKQATELNKNAHFWRENYQLIAIENLIKSFENPTQLIDYNLLGKTTLSEKKLKNKWNNKVCWNEYYDIYPEVKKEGKNEKEQILDSCPMALKWIIWMIRFWWGPNPYSFVTIGDILTSMWEYELATASYFRALELKHQNSEKIKKYIEKLSALIYPDLNKIESYKVLENQFIKDYNLWTNWSDNYEIYQKNIIKNNIDPTNQKSYESFYEKFNFPQDIQYLRD